MTDASQFNARQRREALKRVEEEGRLQIRRDVFCVIDSLQIGAVAPEDMERLRKALDVTLRPEVRSFANAMEEKLRANDHKGGWEEMRPEWLTGRLKGEVEELCEAVHPAQGPADRFPDRIIGEAADVANFAMMVADVCGGLKK